VKVEMKKEPMTESIFEVQRHRARLRHVIDVVSKSTGPVLSTPDEVVETYLKETLQGACCSDSPAFQRMLEKKDTDCDRKLILWRPKYYLATSYKITPDVWATFIAKNLAALAPLLQHFARCKDGEGLTGALPAKATQEMADILQVPNEGGLRQIIKPLFTEDAFALLDRKAINDYWLLRILQEMPFYGGWALEAYRVHIGIYKVKSTMYLPFGLPDQMRPQWAASDLALPIAKGALLIESEAAIPARLTTNPLYTDDSPREYVTMYSAHGSKCVFDTPERKVPAAPWMTFEEACAFGLNWCSVADTVGGDACVYHVPSGRTTHEIHLTNPALAHWSTTS